eukprot:UN09159
MGHYFCRPSDDDSPACSTDSKATELIQFDFGYGITDKIQICKIVLLVFGEQSGFKTQLIRQYADNKILQRLEIKKNKQIYNLSIWDVPTHICNTYMINIYCQHASSVIIIIDVTNIEALNNAQNLINSIKNTNKSISIIILANKWNSEERIFNDNDLNIFCEKHHDFIIWKKVEIEQDDELVNENIILTYDKTIKQMISKGITKEQKY